jgi:site-specific DNA-cytosine methylase
MTESEGSSVSTSEPEAAPSRGRGRRGRGRRGGGRSGGRGGGGSSSRGHHGGGVSRGCSDGFAVDRSASEATSETEETKRVRLQEVQWKCRKGEKRELDSSHSEGEASPDAPSNLMRYVTWIVDKLDSKDVDCLRAHHSQHTLNIGELCAGMATGTIASKTLESKITEIHGLTVACQTVFYSEMVAWKRALCQEVHKSCGGEHAAPALFKSRTAELNGLKEPKVDLWIGAIECDDVSPLTTTPRSILDREGRSGSSFMEMLDVLSSCGMDARPRFIMLECVAALDKLRKAVNEKGTKVATDKLAELGYAGSWNLLNTRDFGLPQSRSRTYGVFVMRSAGFGMHGQEIHMKQVQRVWDFVASCKIDKPDVLAKFLSDAKFAMLADEMSDAKKKNDKKKVENKNEPKKPPVWKKQHATFKETWKIADSELKTRVQKALVQQKDKLNLTEREVECAILKLALHMRKNIKNPVDQDCLVANIGDSLNYVRFNSTCHPCLLPTKKYLYIFQGHCFTNSNVTGNLYLRLQGLGPEEVEKAGLGGLDQRQSQELAGNAFTSNIVAAIVLAILVNWK